MLLKDAFPVGLTGLRRIEDKIRGRNERYRSILEMVALVNDRCTEALGIESGLFCSLSLELGCLGICDTARKDNDVNTMAPVRMAFIKYMVRMFDRYEAYSQEVVDRDIPQTMVLTSSRLVVDSADELFGIIRDHGYSFVAMDEALSDKAYTTRENMIGELVIPGSCAGPARRVENSATSQRSTTMS